MSEYHIPFHVQEEIMKRLPVKSLIRFRRVSKAWKSLIDSSEFIAAHHPQQQHLLVSYQDLQEEDKYACFIDDDTFPQHKSHPTPPPPLSAKQITVTHVVGSSRGLVCLHGWDYNFETPTILLWNPSIRKYIVVAVPAKIHDVGFGVCPVTNDPKIVLITQFSWDEPEARYKCEVMVYTLSSGKWTSPPTKRNRDPYCSVVTNGGYIYQDTVATDGFIYWRAVSHASNCIMSFDVANENFEVIDLPDTLACCDLDGLYIRKLRESLAILLTHWDTCTCAVVWMMEDGVPRSFTKLFIIKTHPYSVIGFSKSGVPIREVSAYDGDDDDVVYEPFKLVYEPNSEHNNVLEMSTTYGPYSVNAYTETLLLLGRSDCISY